MQKKKLIFFFKFAKYICTKKAENNISKKHAKKAEMQKKTAKKSRWGVLSLIIYQSSSLFYQLLASISYTIKM